MTTLLTIENITCDTTAIESDGLRWFGRLTLTCGNLVAVGTWVGNDRSEDGRLVDVDGKDEAFCERLDELVDEIERVVGEALGRPCAEDASGLFSALDAVSQARAERAA